MKIAINGFGRIGKTFLRVLLQDDSLKDQIEVVAINIGPATRELVGHLFKYDTLMGTFAGSVELAEDLLIINNKKIKIFAQKDPATLPWKDLAIDWVVECSGHFTDREGASKHLQAGAQRVLVSAPCKGDDATIILGVNDTAYNNSMKILSIGSCTSNAFIPMVKVIDDAFSIKNCFMTTVHAYTNTQALVDVDVHDGRRSRAAALNIVPASSGATTIIKKVLPHLAERVDGCALRVPVAKVSLVDLTFITEKQLTVESINRAFEQVSQGAMQSILEVTREELVSSDFADNPHSVIIDASMTQVVGNTGKAFGWYDNEWGYCQRLKDFLMQRVISQN